MDDRRLVIIGNGIAGITAARHVRKRSSMSISIISSETKYFFSRTALMYVYMGHMKFEHTKPYEDSFWEKNNIELIQDTVLNVQTDHKLLKLASGVSIDYDQLIIATGSRTATYDWPGLDLKGVQGLYSFQDLQSMEQNTHGIKSAAIVGGGLIGVEMAEMLHSRGIQVDYLVREDGFWRNILPKEESDTVGDQLKRAGINLHYNTELKSIHGDSKVEYVMSSSEQRINCEFLGITTGVRPNISFLSGSGIETEKGVLVDEYLKTSVDGVYAIGDCAQLKNPPKGRKPIEAVWYVGKMMGEVVAASICGETTEYAPSHWFNSAKFFNLEYQTYGEVSTQKEDSVRSLLWQSDRSDLLLRLNYNQQDQRLLGINALGIRLDHRQCDQWLKGKSKIKEVVDHLEMADFNPEFHNIPFDQIKNEFKRQINE